MVILLRIEKKSFLEWDFGFKYNFMKKVLKEFKHFAIKGNLIDMAVAFIMGGAFGKVVTSFIDGLIMPIVGLLTAGADFKSLKYILLP